MHTLPPAAQAAIREDLDRTPAYPPGENYAQEQQQNYATQTVETDVSRHRQAYEGSDAPTTVIREH
jgi:hypothetical protein